MPFFTSPTSYRLANMEALPLDTYPQTPFMMFKKKKPHDSHPSLDHLILLVFEAVMEVVCVSLPGYIVARLGHFDADKQKFLANLNVMLFTPCLIFTKLASQLNADKLVELGIIPVIFILQTLVSYTVSILVSKAFRFNKRASNFVTAMGVFGNSNSLPISLVISLSQTLKGLHWDKIPGDNDDEVAARGILYLMIFQQLGQLVRWSWGYHVLLRRKETYPDYEQESVEEGQYYDAADAQHEEEQRGLMGDTLDMDDDDDEDEAGRSATDDSEVYEPAGRTPIIGQSRASPADSEDDEAGPPKKAGRDIIHDASPRDFQDLPEAGMGGIACFPRIINEDEQEIPEGIKGVGMRAKRFTKKVGQTISNRISKRSRQAYHKLPRPLQTGLAVLYRIWIRLYAFLWEFMNPPLWAMLLAIIVASVPDLQRLFFQEGSFVKNSVTSAISSSAGVAVPLILVVLGANLARNTQNQSNPDPEEVKMGGRLLVASLICRMVLPTLIMTPILAVFAKYVPVSILDDPIFVIVCFLLTGAPSALQLAQICQINGVFETVMSKILFQSYVIWILPSTLILVMAALEVVEWAA